MECHWIDQSGINYFFLILQSALDIFDETKTWRHTFNSSVAIKLPVKLELSSTTSELFFQGEKNNDR